jgi:hypothetical protein
MSWLSQFARENMSGGLSAVKEPILFVLAIYAAFLSTLNWVQAYRRERRSIRATTSTAIPAYSDGRTGECFSQIRATNVGQRAVTVRWLGFRLETGECLISTGNSFPGLSDTPLPATLSDGQSADIFMSYSNIAKGLLHNGRSGVTKLVPVCEDSAGGVYKGLVWQVDPNDLIHRSFIGEAR